MLRTLILSVTLLLVACGGSETSEPAASEPVGIAEFIAANEKLYSQFDEELIIRHFFQDERDGVFLDVGCAYPIKLNTTYYLERHLGWTGVAIDAFHYYRDQWAKERPATPLLTNAVGDEDGGWVTFHVAGEPSVSSLDKEQAEQWGGPAAQPIRVPAITLTKALEQQGIEKVDFVSLDIEGAEPAALRGFDIDRFAPRLVCVEAHAKGEGNESEIVRYFKAHGYERIEEYLPHDAINWYFRPEP